MVAIRVWVSIIPKINSIFLTSLLRFIWGPENLPYKWLCEVTSNKGNAGQQKTKLTSDRRQLDKCITLCYYNYISDIRNMHL